MLEGAGLSMTNVKIQISTASRSSLIFVFSEWHRMKAALSYTIACPPCDWNDLSLDIKRVVVAFAMQNKDKASMRALMLACHEMRIMVSTMIKTLRVKAPSDQPGTWTNFLDAITAFPSFAKLERLILDCSRSYCLNGYHSKYEEPSDSRWIQSLDSFFRTMPSALRNVKEMKLMILRSEEGKYSYKSSKLSLCAMTKALPLLESVSIDMSDEDEHFDHRSQSLSDDFFETFLKPSSLIKSLSIDYVSIRRLTNKDIACLSPLTRISMYTFDHDDLMYDTDLEGSSCFFGLDLSPLQILTVLSIPDKTMDHDLVQSLALLPCLMNLSCFEMLPQAQIIVPVGFHCAWKHLSLFQGLSKHNFSLLSECLIEGVEITCIRS